MEAIFTSDDEYYMSLALQEAQKAYEVGEVPVGAVITQKGKIIHRSHNLTIQLNDPTAHAEMLAITAATSYNKTRYLSDFTLYVTLEPCPMCAGGLFWTQLGNLVYAAADEKRGYSRLNPPLLHPKTKVKKGILENESKELLKKFFKERR